MAKAEMIVVGILSARVCVPEDWTERQVEVFVNEKSPTGINSDWGIVPESEMEDPQRVQCHEHPENVHIVLWC